MKYRTRQRSKCIIIATAVDALKWCGCPTWGTQVSVDSFRRDVYNIFSLRSFRLGGKLNKKIITFRLSAVLVVSVVILHFWSRNTTAQTVVLLRKNLGPLLFVFESKINDGKSVAVVSRGTAIRRGGMDSGRERHVSARSAPVSTKLWLLCTGKHKFSFNRFKRLCSLQSLFRVI